MENKLTLIKAKIESGNMPSSLEVAKATAEKVQEYRERIARRVLRTKTDDRNLVRIHEAMKS